jgi:hypothetical protein
MTREEGESSVIVNILNPVNKEVLRNSCALGVDYVGSVRARLEELSVLRGLYIQRSYI